MTRFIERAVSNPQHPSPTIYLPPPSEPKRTIALLRDEQLQEQVLVGIRWNNTRIERCNFAAARLVDADLRGSTIIGSFFRGAIFTHVNLADARLTNCDLGGVDLSTTDLRGADLRHTFGLTTSQVRRAIIDEETLLPAHLAVRVHAAPAAGVAR